VNANRQATLLLPYGINSCTHDRLICIQGV
jgi:hypothetical protein